MREDIGHLSIDTILHRMRREHLLDSTVSVVLIGNHTWGRKWVDWEIYSSLRPYADRTINGLVGIYLPKHRKKEFRLTDNARSGYALTLKWDELDEKFIDTVHSAWNKRRRYDLIENSRPLRYRNAPLEPKKRSQRQSNVKRDQSVLGQIWDLFFGE